MTDLSDPTRTQGGPRHRSDDALTLATADLVVDLVTTASGEFEVETILQATLQRLAGLVSFTGGSVALVDGDDLVIRAAVGPFADEAMGQRLRRGPSRSWNVVQTGEPFLSNDLQAAGLAIRTPTGRDAVHSWLGVPLVLDGRGIGLLEVDSTEPDAFDEGTERLMTIVARVLSGPIDLAWRHEEDRRSAALREAFIGVISHELRTPITTIYGTSRLLRSRGEKLAPEKRAELLADVEEEADRLYRLVEDLLVLSRAERGRVEIAHEPILLGHVVQRAVQAEQARWPDRRFRVDSPGGLPAVAGEETYAEQVVRNLLSNAAKYSTPDSTIEVSVEADADEVRIRVLDEGVGISPDDAARLFELFYRGENAARQAPGAGIGLFVVSQLVRAMGGRAWGHPREGRGSEFGIALPTAALDDA